MQHSSTNFTARARVAAIGLGLIVALTGCSAGGGASGNAGGSTDKKTADEGPLQKYISALDESSDFSEETMNKAQAATEALIAECMSKEGFEYEPFDGSYSIAADPAPSGAPEEGTLEYAEQYGYGLSDSPGREQTETELDDQPEVPVDPNAEYFESLSESEQAAFTETMYGSSPDEPADPDAVYDWKQAGCQGAAQHEVEKDASGATGAWADPANAELFESIGAVYTKYTNPENPAPETIILNEEWASCMAEAGFSDYGSPDDAVAALLSELNALSGTGAEDEAPVEPSAEDTAAFTKHEIEVAVADVKCNEKVGYDAEIKRLNDAAEQEFVDEHKAELDALLAKYATKQ